MFCTIDDACSGLFSLCAWQHSMIYFFHHYELPSILQRSGLDLGEPARAANDAPVAESAAVGDGASAVAHAAGSPPNSTTAATASLQHQNQRSGSFHSATVRLNGHGGITLQQGGDTTRVAFIRTVYIGNLLNAAALGAAASHSASTQQLQSQQQSQQQQPSPNDGSPGRPTTDQVIQGDGGDTIQNGRLSGSGGEVIETSAPSQVPPKGDIEEPKERKESTSSSCEDLKADGDAERVPEAESAGSDSPTSNEPAGENPPA